MLKECVCALFFFTLYLTSSETQIWYGNTVWQYLSHPSSPLQALNLVSLFKSVKWRSCKIALLWAFFICDGSFVLPLISIYVSIYLYPMVFIFNQLDYSCGCCLNHNNFHLLGRMSLAGNICHLQRNTHGSHLLLYLTKSVHQICQKIPLPLDEQCQHLT